MFGIGCYYADTFTYNTDILVVCILCSVHSVHLLCAWNKQLLCYVAQT